MLKIDIYEVLVEFNAPMTISGARTGVMYGGSLLSAALGPGDHVVVHSSDFEELATYIKRNNELIPVVLTEEFVVKNTKLFKKVL